MAKRKTTEASAPTLRNRIVEYGVKSADQFLANPKNARVHPQFQRDVMKAALEEVGFVAPVIESKSGVLLDGHERVWQGLQNDNAQIPFVVVDVDEAEEDYVLATFDPITSLANYDAQQLDALLKDVNSDSSAIQQMLSELAEANGLYQDATAGEDPGSFHENASDLQAKWQTERGQLWQIGKHRLQCGDSTSTADAERLIAGSSDYTFFCDPFYQDDLIGRLYELYSFSEAVFLTGGRQLKDVLSYIDHFHEGVLLGCACNPQMGNTKRLMNQHKVIIWTSSETLEFGLGYSSIVEPEERAARLHGDVYHHTTKPVDAIEKILKPFSQTVIVDAFAGAGSTFVAAQRLGRHCFGMEIDPGYCAAILERLSLMGLEPRMYSDASEPEAAH